MDARLWFFPYELVRENLVEEMNTGVEQTTVDCPVRSRSNALWCSKERGVLFSPTSRFQLFKREL